MASLDKEVEILMLKGQRGYSSYEEAVANALFSGTLEEWIETFATPDNYVTRYEFQKVTQAEYEALEEAGQLVPNCYYLITDDDTWETIQDIISRVETLESSMTTAQGDIEDIQEDIGALESNVTNLSVNVEHLEEDRLLTRTLINDNTDTGYQYIGNASYEWTVNAPNTNNDEYLYILKGTIKYNSSIFEDITIVIDASGIGASTHKEISQYLVISGLGLVKIAIDYYSSTLGIRAYLIDLTTFTTSAVSYCEFKVNSFKAVANWK